MSGTLAMEAELNGIVKEVGIFLKSNLNKYKYKSVSLFYLVSRGKRI